MAATVSNNRPLDRVDRLSPWAFTGSLYLVRWLVVVPLGEILKLFGPTGTAIRPAEPVVEFAGGVVLDPLVETAIECALPYWLMRKAFEIRADGRPWKFVVVSASIMTLLHIGAWPATILPSLVTEGFLAYVYGHFATQRPGQALLHTWAFHSAINIVGWAMAVFF